jgi:hypothetical protein
VGTFPAYSCPVSGELRHTRETYLDYTSTVRLLRQQLLIVI